MDYDRIDMRLQSPTTVVISGPTGSGKTVLMKDLISNASSVSSSPPVEIVYCYSVHQPVFDVMQEESGVRFHEGLVDIKRDWSKDRQHQWLIIDDLMGEATKKGSIDDIYTKFSHHFNITVFFLIQNLFRKEHRTISLNTQYMILLRNPRDATVVSTLAQQMYPGQSKFLTEAYAEAMSKPHGHLLLNLTQSANPKARVIGNFGSPYMKSWVPK